MRQDIESLTRWFSDKGDYTHNLNYDLNENSTVIDLGGFKGLWIDEILKKLNPIVPNIILVEPVPEFYNYLVEKFKTHKKIKVINCGVSTDGNEHVKNLYISTDGSSTNFKNNSGDIIQIKTLPIEKILQDNNIDKVDLLQINIEGDEYGLIEHMLNEDIVQKINNIQVQFHLGVENDQERRNNIQKELTFKGFKNKFDYPFVWESWAK
jgi:FkbM family methyltransferase